MLLFATLLVIELLFRVLFPLALLVFLYWKIGKVSEESRLSKLLRSSVSLIAYCLLDFFVLQGLFTTWFVQVHFSGYSPLLDVLNFVNQHFFFYLIILVVLWLTIKDKTRLWRIVLIFLACRILLTLVIGFLTPSVGWFP